MAPVAPPEWINRFWVRMLQIYGSRWTSQYGDTDDGTWSAALGRVGGEIIARAISRLAIAGGEWPPSLPEFLAHCRREAGLPNADAAYRDAAHARWSHEVVYETARRIGIHEVRVSAERSLMPSWREAYNTVCAEWMSGTRFAAPKTERLTRPVPKTRTVAVGQLHIERMRKLVGAPPPSKAAKPIPAEFEPLNDEEFIRRRDQQLEVIETTLRQGQA